MLVRFAAQEQEGGLGVPGHDLLARSHASLEDGRPWGLGVLGARLGLKQAECELGLAQVWPDVVGFGWLEQLGQNLGLEMGP